VFQAHCNSLLATIDGSSALHYAFYVRVPRILLAEAMFRRFSEDFIEIAATWSIWIAAADNNRTGFFNFGLTHSGLAQATLLFGAPDHDKAPRLKIAPIPWLGALNYIDFLRDYGRHFSVNSMLTYDSVKLRLEREQPAPRDVQVIMLNRSFGAIADVLSVDLGSG
jgi:hypothetical protein